MEWYKLKIMSNNCDFISLIFRRNDPISFEVSRILTTVSFSYSKIYFSLSFFFSPYVVIAAKCHKSKYKKTK